jgi:DNA-binding transcriptional MerR regulator
MQQTGSGRPPAGMPVFLFVRFQYEIKVNLNERTVNMPSPKTPAKTIQAIQRMRKEGFQLMQIAKHLRVSRKTVQRYCSANAVTTPWVKQIRIRWKNGESPETIKNRYGCTLEEIQKICTDIPFISKAKQEKRKQKAQTEPKVRMKKGRPQKYNGKKCRICGKPLKVNYFYCENCHRMLCAGDDTDLNAAGQVAVCHSRG